MEMDTDTRYYLCRVVFIQFYLFQPDLNCFHRMVHFKNRTPLLGGAAQQWLAEFFASHGYTAGMADLSVVLFFPIQIPVPDRRITHFFLPKRKNRIDHGRQGVSLQFFSVVA